MRPQVSAMTHWKLCISAGLEMPPCPQKSWVSRLGKSTSGHLCSDCWPCHLDSDKERLVFLAEYKITPFTFIYFHLLDQITTRTMIKTKWDDSFDCFVEVNTACCGMHHLIFTKDISIKRYKSQKEGKKEGKQRQSTVVQHQKPILSVMRSGQFTTKGWDETD